MQNAAREFVPPAPGPDLATLYREHGRRVMRAAYRVTGNAEDAEDVLQTIFLRLARREGGAPPSDSLGHYLHRAAINAGLDVVRSKRARRSSSMEGLEGTLADADAPSPERIRHAGEIRGLVRAALASESPKSAEIFALRYFEGFDNHEIAKMVGTSRSTVGVILHRTRQRLREAIAPSLGEPS